MKVAVASMGTVPEAWVGTRFGMCSQFLIFDLETMEYVVVTVPPVQEHPDQVSLAAIRAVATQGVEAVITGHIKPICRQTLLDLGIEVVDGVEGMTVAEAIERYKVTGLELPEERRGMPTRIAIVSQGDGLEARLDAGLSTCSTFVLVDPQTKVTETVQVEPVDPSQKANLEAIRTVVRSGATVLITPQIRPECCMALHSLAVMVYIAPPDITVGEAVDRYEAGELEQSLITPWAGQ